jgi:hypothetical protein
LAGDIAVGAVIVEPLPAPGAAGLNGFESLHAAAVIAINTHVTRTLIADFTELDSIKGFIAQMKGSMTQIHICGIVLFGGFATTLEIGSRTGERQERECPDDGLAGGSSTAGTAPVT